MGFVKRNLNGLVHVVGAYEVIGMKMKWFVGVVCLVVGAAVPCCVVAQAPVPAAEQAELTRTVAALDTKLFDAYNHCDLKTLGAMVSDDLEFYHDQTGLMVGKAPFLAAIQNNICGKVERTLVPGTLEVHRLKGYGAVEIGVHRFRKAGDDNDVGGEAKFVHVWQNKDGVWRVTRVISYDHASLEK
jgi:ketosteroid isomerase-like protein